MANINVQEVKLQLLYFKEEVEGDLTHYFYSPALDLYGYGDTKKDAEASFQVHLEEFIRYTTHEGTFLSELKRLGWQDKGKKQVSPPSIADKFNSQSVQSLLKKQPKMYPQKTSMPVCDGYAYA